MEAIHGNKYRQKNLLEPQWNYFNYITDSQRSSLSGSTGRQLTLDNQLFPTGWEQNVYLMRFYTLTLTKQHILNLAKGSGSLYSNCNFDMSSDYSSTKYIITVFCSTKCIITIQTSIISVEILKSLCLRIDWNSSLRQSLNSLTPRGLFLSTSITLPLII